MAPWALEKNSNGGIKRASEILLFSHKKYVCNTKLPFATKLVKVVTYVEGFPAIKSYYHIDHNVLPDHMKNYNYYISCTTMLMVTKLGIIVTYLEGLLPILSKDPLITWSSVIKWQIKNIATTGMVVTHRSSQP